MFVRLNRKIINYVLGGPLFSLNTIGRHGKEPTVNKIAKFLKSGINELKKDMSKTNGNQRREDEENDF